VAEFVSRAGREGFTVKELRSRLKDVVNQENGHAKRI
jgi:hypothetical protein